MKLMEKNMARLNFLVTLIFIAVLMLTGCAGVRNSYESLLDTGTDKPVITLKVGDVREILAIGDGFPGWWGYYPGIVSHDPNIAEITCELGRGLIPFREPGVIFGGETCNIKAQKVGIAWLLMGNRMTLHGIISKADLSKFTAESQFPPQPKDAEKLIKVHVVPAP
jgi:hypothetical protein